MKVDKMSVSFEAQLGASVRHAAEFLDDWEAEHGAPTAEELAEANRKLGLPALPHPEPEAPATA